MTRWSIRRRAARLRDDVDGVDAPVDCLVIAEAIERQVRSGSTLTSALQAVARTHRQRWCRDVVQSIDRGSTLANAAESRLADEMRRRRPDGDLMLTLRVLSMAAEVGGEPTRHIDALADTLRARRHAAADRLTQASTALASIRLLTWLPVVCAVWMVVDDPGVRAVLLASPVGWACIAAGVVFNLLGRHWTTRLVHRL